VITNVEVIVAASSLNSPKLLMLSGIGPAAHLAETLTDVIGPSRCRSKTCKTIWSFIFQRAAAKPVAFLTGTRGKARDRP
jgi:choline dehydrogenase